MSGEETTTDNLADLKNNNFINFKYVPISYVDVELFFLQKYAG